MAGPTAANPIAWYKADALVLSDNDPVGTWTDSSGTGNDATQGTGSAKPTYKTNQVNGLAAVDFDGGDWLTTPLAGLTRPLSVFCVVKPTDFSSSRAILGASAAGDGALEWRLNTSSVQEALSQYIVQIGTSSTPLTPDAYVRVAFTYTVPGAYVFYKDGLADGSGTNQQTNALGTLQIGAIHSGSVDPMLGQIAELLVYDSVLSAGDLGDVDDYLYNKYFVVPTPPALFGYTPRVRENPPLRLHILAHTPSGKTFRWGQDERRAENNYSGLNFATTIPGGFETLECSLPRKVGVNYQDLTRLSTLTVKGAGGEVAAEHRLEKTPRSSGTERTIQPQAVGWQAHLDDDNEAAEVYVDRDLNNWGGMSRLRQLNLYSGGVETLEDGSVSPDTTTGIPALIVTINGSEGDTVDHYSESWYDAGPACTIGSIYYDMTSVSTAADWSGSIGTSSDDLGTATSGSGDLLVGANSSAVGTLTPTAYRFATVQFSVAAPSEGDHAMHWRRLTVWGNHGLTKRGTAPSDGLYASDVIANAISRWCPLLHFTTGSDGSIRSTAFVVPQLEFRAFTTAAEILTQSNRFHLWDWAVWEGQRDAEPTFYYNERNGRGKRWRARVAPSNLQETGPQVDRLWNGVIVSYQDVDGTTKTVGPTGSLADATDANLLDTDSLNPVNQLGMKRYAKLDMGIVSTSAGATEVGRQFLERSKELDQSGSADLVGYVTDDHGVNRPSWAVRAGDQISFVDSSDPSYRRIVHTAYDHSTRSNSIDLDSPPEGMDALLEELGASLNLGTPPPALSMGINPELGTFGFG